MNKLESTSDFLFYTGNNGNTKIQIILGEETVWTTQKGMSEIFDVEVPNVSKHLKNIFEEGELSEEATVSKMEIVQMEGAREVKRTPDFYNLDAIIAVGYRVNSYKATKFRIWATNILKEYLLKGFVLDDDRLKQSKKIFGKDYFEELLERIREIRASERRFYQKITDIYQQCSIDYDSKAPITQSFFATVQNKLEFAITHLTAAEIIKARASSKKPHMGLNTWENSPHGKILKKDISVAKNYLDHKEIDELNSIVTMYLDFAELQAKRNKAMKMSDWVQRLDSFLSFNEYDILKDAGKLRKSVADAFAEKEYSKFRVIQDREYKSDFDQIAIQIKTTGKLPKELSPTKETAFNQLDTTTLKVPSPTKKEANPKKRKGK